jgi:hypothetical protein
VKSSAADAQQSKVGAGKQRNLLRYSATQQQLWGTHSCGKLETCDASIGPHWAEAEGTQGAPRKMRRQGAATLVPTHFVS